MDRDVLIKEIMWYYDYTRKQAEQIVKIYEEMDKYSDLCDLIIYKRELSMSL